eukprot:Hpha_TRINITY_DN14741_c0_g1::TRINITY_DN14741_c0_g1_i1::g.102329::m.102329
MAAAAAEDGELLVSRLESLLESEWGDDRDSRLRELRERVLIAVPAPEEIRDAKKRASALGLRGRALLAVADGPSGDASRTEASQLLAKAVKMDGGLVMAWCALGRLAWYQGRLKDALEAYAGALAVDEHCLSALRDSARVLRRQGGVENIEQACERSKKAVGKGLQDGLSWYVHGMVLLSRYFLTLNMADLKSSLKAFAVATRNGQDGNPDLHMNRAQAESYLVMWTDSITSLRRAIALDPQFVEAKASLETLTESLGRLRTKWESECGYQEKAMAKLLKQLPASGETRPSNSGPLKVVGIKELPTEGEGGCLSKQECLVLRVLELVNDSSVPLVYIAVDAARQLCCLAVYGYERRAIGSGNEVVYAAAPFYRRRVPTIAKGGESVDTWETPVVVVDTTSPMLVNGRGVDKALRSRPQLSVESKGT